MKTALIIISLLCTSILSFSQAKPNTKSTSDTIRSVAVYIEPYQGRISTDYVFKIVKDTTTFEAAGDDTFKKVSKRDTFYYVPTVLPIMDQKTKKPQTDSKGNIKQELKFLPVGRENILYDFNRKL